MCRAAHEARRRAETLDWFPPFEPPAFPEPQDSPRLTGRLAGAWGEAPHPRPIFDLRITRPLSAAGALEVRWKCLVNALGVRVLCGGFAVELLAWETTNATPHSQLLRQYGDMGQAADQMRQTRLRTRRGRSG